MSLVDDIKNQAKKAGTNKGKLVYFKEGAKVRVRFLQDMDEGMKVSFHDSFEKGVNTPCQEQFGKKCKRCDDESLRTRDLYTWSVWDYDAKEVKLMPPFAVNNASPIPGLVGMYDAYGTLTDRDYVITQNGKGTTKTFSVVPMDKVKFRNDKAKPFSKSKVLEILDKAFPDDDNNNGDNDGDSKDYDNMSPKELYALCKERDIEVEKKKSSDYYINKLGEYDEAQQQQDDWGDDDDDEKPDYSSMSPKELYSLCKERDIEVEQKKKVEYYIEKLEAADNESDDWGDDSDEDKDDMPW